MIGCPRCGSRDVSLVSPDYGQGAEFTCWSCDRAYGRRFVSRNHEALAASAESKETSAANAETIEKMLRDLGGEG